MTFAPPTLLAVRHYFQARYPWLGDNELGIAGGPSHIAAGTSYHLGRDQLKMSRRPYSARTRRDLAGLSNAASAFDLDDSLGGGAAELRELSVWVVGQCRAGAPDTLDLREVIFSPDGRAVLTWDRERGRTSYPMPRGDSSHRTHTHFSFYRDSERRDKVGLFRRFYDERDQQQRKVAPDMMFLEHDDPRVRENPVYVSDGFKSRRMPEGTWPFIKEARDKHGVPYMVFSDLDDLFAFGGKAE